MAYFRFPTRFVAQCLVLALVVQAANAYEQDPLWGQKMFEVAELNFGAAAKGADAVIQVKVKNIYKEDIQVTNLTTGCGCVSWEDLRDPASPLPIVIPSGQHRILTLRLNTIQYEGERKSKASISLLDQVHGASTIVDLPVLAYIRKDIVVTPGAVNFGVVDAGSGGEKKVEIHYAGRNDWKVTQTKVTNPNLTAQIKETARGNGLVNYELVVTLKPDAAVGTVRDQLILVTDDANNPHVPILVEAKVEADIAVTDLSFGTMSPGQSITRTVVIRGRKPFKIEELYRSRKDGSRLQDEAFKVKLDKSTSTVHAMPITFTAPDLPGSFEEDFYVKIADRPQEILFKARGRISEQTGAAKN